MVKYLKAKLISASLGTPLCDVLVFKAAANDEGDVRFCLIAKGQASPRLPGVWLGVSPQAAIDLGHGLNIGFTEGVIEKMAHVPAGECPRWMSITSFCAYLDSNSSYRESLLGDYTISPVRHMTCEPALDLDVDTMFGTVSTAPDTNASISRPQGECVAIMDGYTRNETYTGYSGYHHNQRTHRFNTPVVPDKPWRIGIELEVYARSQQAYNTITGARSNWFQCESDSSLHEAAHPIELKTIPLRACDAKSIEFWDAPMRKLASLAKSKGYSSTGLHVHIGKEVLGETETERQETLNKLCWFYVYRVENVPAAHEKNVIIAGRERGYSGTLDASKDEFADFAELIGYKAVAASKPAFDKIASAVKLKVQHQRWDINLGHYSDYGTIEFRKADGRISKTRIAAVVTWWEQMTLYCRNHSQSELDFDDFFETVCREYPGTVGYFFNQDEES